MSGSSTIIEYLRSSSDMEAKSAVAYFYFDFNDAEKQGVQSFVSSLIVQLCRQLPELPEELEDLHSKCNSGQQILTLQRLTAALKNLMASFRSVHIVVDALDECPKGGGERDELLKVVLDLSYSGFQLLVTSRREMDIAETFKSEASISIGKEFVEADSKLHVANELTKDKRLDRFASDVKSDIERTLLEESNGM